MAGVHSARRILDGLAAEGHSVRVARDAADLSTRVEDVDCFLIGLSREGTFQVDVCRRVRERSAAPIIAITDQASELATVLGLELGADDYVAASIGLPELLARMRAVTRRVAVPMQPSRSAPRPLIAGDVVVDVEAHEVTLAGRGLALPRKEFDLLVALMEDAGRVVPRQRLLDRVWGERCTTDTKTLDVHIQRLRARLCTDASDPRRILTVRGVGYKFEPSPSSAMASASDDGPALSVIPLHGHRELPPELRRTSQLLSSEFSGRYSPETVERAVNETFDSLSENATLHTFLPLLVERTVRQQLRATTRLDDRWLLAPLDILFVCVHNAGRSQMAEGFARHLAAGRIHAFSAGSLPADRVDPVVAQAMLERGIDIQHVTPRPLTDDLVRAADVVVTMGCGDACPVYPGKRYVDWKIEDTSGRTLEEMRPIRDEIDRLVTQLIGGLTEASSARS